MKRIFIIITILVAFFGLLLGIAESFDWDQYRSQLSAQLSQELGAKVELKGKLSISVLPVPRLEADDAEFESPGIFIRAPSLRMAMKFWPMMTGHIVLTRAEIINPEIRLTPEKWPVAAPAANDDDSSNVQLQNVTIKNGHLRLQLGKHQEIFRGINLKLAAPDWHGPYQASGNFARNDVKWKFDSVMGVITATGTRPLEMTLTKASDDLEIKWQGAFMSSPLALQGDGLVQWKNAPPVIWAGEMNLKDDVLDITRGAVAAGDAELGSVVGKYDLDGDRWIELSASLHNIMPHFMAQMPRLDRWHGWLTGQRISTLDFNWKDNSYKDFKLNTAILEITKDKQDWLIKGRNAAAMFAEMTGGNAHDWPVALSTPFMLRIDTTSGPIKIKDLNFDQTSFSGSLSGQKISLRTNNMLWDHWLNGKAPWRALLLQNNIRELNVKIGNLDALPFALGEGEVNLFLDDEASRVFWRVSGFQVTGTWQKDKFDGKLSCKGKVNFWPLLRGGCLMADVKGDQDIWRFTPPADLVAGAASFTGNMDFRQGSWQLNAAAAGGKITGSGKLGNDDWRLNLDNVSLRQWLASRLPNAPLGDGKVSANLLVINNSARGEITARDLNLGALNLSATEKLGMNSELQKQGLRQAGNISSLKAILKWQNDTMWFDNLQTEGPMGYGKAQIDFDKKEWSGEWQGSGARVLIDGPVDKAYAETRESVIDQPRR